MDMTKYVTENVEKVYVRKNGKTYLASDMLRKQVEGLYELMKAGKSFEDFKVKDFSETGAARTMALDVKKWFRKVHIR